jgi:hypothetical protein
VLRPDANWAGRLLAAIASEDDGEEFTSARLAGTIRIVSG